MFTFPIMVHPIHEIVEGNLKENWWFRKLSQIDDDNNSTTISGKFGIYISRAVVVVGLAVLASEIPGFGIFVSLVGSTVCALISFVLPATFHLLLLGSSLCFWQRALDFCVLVCGLLFAAYGAYMAVIGVYLNWICCVWMEFIIALKEMKSLQIYIFLGFSVWGNMFC